MHIHNQQRRRGRWREGGDGGGGEGGEGEGSGEGVLPDVRRGQRRRGRRRRGRRRRRWRRRRQWRRWRGWRRGRRGRPQACSLLGAWLEPHPSGLSVRSGGLSRRTCALRSWSQHHPTAAMGQRRPLLSLRARPQHPLLRIPWRRRLRQTEAAVRAQKEHLTLLGSSDTIATNSVH